MCHACKAKDATINGLREQVATMQERERRMRTLMDDPYADTPRSKTSMGIPITLINERGLSPRGIKKTVNAFDKD